MKEFSETHYGECRNCHLDDEPLNTKGLCEICHVKKDQVWRVVKIDCGAIIETEASTHVCTMSGVIPIEETYKVAAAPELLEACEKALDEWYADEDSAIYEKVKAAVAKAKGGI